MCWLAHHRRRKLQRGGGVSAQQVDGCGAQRACGVIRQPRGVQGERGGHESDADGQGRLFEGGAAADQLACEEAAAREGGSVEEG
eukprot:scaffold12891_cov118-Isochrysis_galbana.AAC.1